MIRLAQASVKLRAKFEFKNPCYTLARDGGLANGTEKIKR
jgi:hypothetical protein